MSLLLWLVFGALAGWLATLVMGVNRRVGLLGNLLLGIAGAAVGGFLAAWLGLGTVTAFSWWGLIVAVGWSLRMHFPGKPDSWPGIRPPARDALALSYFADSVARLSFLEKGTRQEAQDCKASRLVLTLRRRFLPSATQEAPPLISFCVY